MGGRDLFYTWLFCDRAYSKAYCTEIIIHYCIIAVEEKEIGGVGVNGVWCRTPVVSFLCTAIYGLVDTGTAGRKKYAIAISGFDIITRNTISCCPVPSAQAVQLFKITLCGNAPVLSPFLARNIVRTITRNGFVDLFII
jgi:hypothetical protein